MYSAYLIDLASAFVAVEYMDYGFEKRYTGKRRVLSFLAAVILYDGIINILNRLFTFEGALGFFYGLILFFYGLFSLRGKWYHFLTMAVAYVFIALTSTYAIFETLSIARGEGLGEILPLSGETLVVFSVIALIMKFFIGRIAIVLLHPRNVYQERDRWILSGVFALAALISMGVFWLEMGGTDGKVSSILTVSILLGEIILVTTLLEMYLQLEVYKSRELTNMREEEQIRHQHEKLREAGRIYHDMNGILMTLEQLIKNGKYVEALGHLNELLSKVSAYPQFECSTGNEGLDVALIKMAEECREAGIPFSYSVLCDISEFNSMDLMRLLDNLFRNALESVKVSGAGTEIEFRLFWSEDGTMLLLKNGITEPVLKNNPQLVSKKPDKIFHGYGMENVFEIIKKYDGQYECWEENNTFCQRIVLESDNNNLLDSDII